MYAHLCVTVSFYFFLLLDQANSEIPHRRFEYKFSFKPPYLAQRDGSVPFWQYGGNAIASADNIRLAPSLKSQKGAIWSKSGINFDWWEVELTFRVTGRGRIGADGMAFWYITQPGSYSGTVFGSSDKWVGLGIFFDSFDNDNNHNNPYIMAMVNDGTKVFDHTNDGSNQMLTGCLRDFRNKPYSTRARIEYYKGILTVLFHNGNTQNENDYDVCMRIENVYLPKSGVFGVSAATGGLADDHDVIQFLTHSLYPPDSRTHPQVELKPEEDTKLSQEYYEYQRKLEIQKEQYKREHPEAYEKHKEEEDLFESDSERELRQVLSVQGQMYEAIRILGNKLDEVIGRQERTLSMLSTVPRQTGAPVQHYSPDPSQFQIPSGAGIEGISAAQKELYNSILELRNFVVDVNRKAESILNNQIRQPTAQVHSVGNDNSALLRELQDNINAVRQDVSSTAQKVTLMKQDSCPNISCLSITVFFSVAFVQIFALIGYFIYRDSRESHAKKFY